MLLQRYLVVIALAIMLAAVFFFLFPGHYGWTYFLLAILSAVLGWWAGRSGKQHILISKKEPLFDQTFLLNTLHNINALMNIDKKKAGQTVQRLADYVRSLMAHYEQDATLLSHQVRCAGIYLEIEHARLADRLAFKINVPRECYEVKVPKLFLQPLLESAVRYGAEYHDSKTRITIVASCKADGVVVDISDVSDNFDEEPEKTLEKRKPVIQLLKNRLNAFYQQKVPVELFSVVPSGCRIVMTLPVSRPQ